VTALAGSLAREPRATSRSRHDRRARTPVDAATDPLQV
jgi:hypothetical protein